MKKQGQIMRGTVFGEMIYEIAKSSSYIVDIGTWFGMGTTKCIIDGIKENPNFKEGYSIDCNKDRLKKAKKNLGRLPKNFYLIEGTIVDSEELYDIRNSLDGVELGWINEDIECIDNVPNVLDELPEWIDLLVIDGGEFSGWIEFLRLHDRSKYIALDDTNVFKHSKSKEFILSQPHKFEVLRDDTEYRNGFLICKNLEYGKLY